MKIKVQQKEGTYTTMIPGLLATIAFFLVGGGMLFSSLFELFKDFTFDNFIIVFSENGMLTLFGLAFFLLSLYLLSFLFRGAKKYAAILKNIDMVGENGKVSYNYEFELVGDSDSVFDKYKCYTNEDYSLEIGKTYALRIKQFNWSVKAIEEVDETVEVTKKKKKRSETSGMEIVCYLFFLIFGGGIVFILIKMGYDFINGNNEFLYNIMGIVFYSLFFVPVLFLYFGLIYDNKSLKEKILYDTEKISKKLKRLDEVKKIVSNVQFNGEANIDLSNVTSFIVSRAPFNEQDNYEVKDDHYDNKLYKVINEDKKYFLHDSIDCAVAEIKVEKKDNGAEIIFVPLDGSSFAIYYKEITGYGYRVVGRDYSLKVIDNVLTLSNREGINIGTLDIEHNKTFPSCMVNLNNTINNEEIIMLCLGVVMIEYHRKKKDSY